MTDTRKEFEDWYESEFDTTTYYDQTDKSWQACQKLNEKRIADLLALVAKKDEALMLQASHMEMYSLQISHANDYAKITRAIDLSPDDVELVEVAEVRQFANTEPIYGRIHKLVDISCEPGGTKLYTIKQKYE